MNDSNQCLLGLDKLQEKHLTMLRPVCLFYRMKSIFPKHIKSWLGVCAALCGVCAKKSPDVMKKLATQFTSTGVFEFKSPSTTEIHLADIPYTEYKLSINNIENLSNIFNICRRICRNSDIHLSDFFAVCEYPNDIPCQEIFDNSFEYEEFDDDNTNQIVFEDEQSNAAPPTAERDCGIESNQSELRTLQVNHLSNTIDFTTYTPIALVVHADEAEVLKRIPATSWQGIVTEVFKFLAQNDNGIFRRYYRNSPSASIISDRPDEQDKDADVLCNTEYKFKYDCTPSQLVRALPDIINQSMLSPEQFAIEYTSGTSAQNIKVPCEADIDDIQKNYFQEALAEQTLEQSENTGSNQNLNNHPFLPPTHCEYVCFSNARNDLDNLDYNAAIRYRNFDADDCKQYTHTKATAVYYDGECIAEVNSWKYAYYEVFVLIQKRYPTFYGSYRKLPCLYPIEQKSSLVDARGDCHAMEIPNTDYCIDTKKSVAQILRDLRRVIGLSALDGSRLFITYEHTEKSLARLNNNAQAIIPKRSSATEQATAYVRRPKSETTEPTLPELLERLEQGTASTQAMRDGDKVTSNDDLISLKANPRPEILSPALELDEQTRQNIEQILAQAFQYGYSHGIRQQEKFKEAYQNTFGESIDCEDLDAAIDSVAFLMDERAYSFDAVLTAQRRDVLMQTIDKWFEDGAPFIEYDALLQACELLPIKAAAALRTYLMHQLGSGYTYNKSSFAQDTTPELDEPLPESIANEVLYTGDITPLDTLAERFPYLTRETIASYLSANDAILSDKERYMHIESIGLDESDIDALNNTLNTLLDANPVLSYNEFIAELKENNESAADQLSNLLEASPTMLQQYLSRKLGDDFSFAKAISRPDDEGVQSGDASIADIMANEFRNKTRIEMSEIEEVVKKYGLIRAQPTVFKYFYESFIRISSNIFISEKELNIHSYIQEIDNTLLAQLQSSKRAYIPIVDCNLNALPNIGTPWNQYLLVQYLYRFTRKCCILSMTITTKFGLGGVMAKRNCNMSYDNILVDFLTTQPSFPASEDEAISLLKEALLIYKHNVKISNLYNRARAMYYQEREG